MKLYTREGDRGFTRTSQDNRVPKSSQLMEALGALDEFMTCCGLVKQALLSSNHCFRNMDEFERNVYDAMDFIQDRIKCISSKLVDNDSSDSVSAEDVKHVEAELDKFAPILNLLSDVLKFGGGKCSSYVQHARAVCRRAERELWRLPSHYLEHHTTTAQFINRISDWLLALSYILINRGE